MKSKKVIDWTVFDKFSEDLVNQLIQNFGAEIKISQARMHQFFKGDSGRRADFGYACDSAERFFEKEIEEAFERAKIGGAKIGRDGTWALMAKGLDEEYILITGSGDIRFLHHEVGPSGFGFPLGKYEPPGFYLWRGSVEEMDSPTAIKRGTCTLERVSGAIADKWIKKTIPKNRKDNI